ncbi:hypothetical protein RMA73_00230 (plasmid) [Xanthomonas translucens pv. translucens]|uniref:hypothetical protein n=1 Tax=Xanthomonas campestris pv. translucens TaxID=343 RepID=UPI0021BB67D5|nr:hypothetical protein [Xanthomonas translucens]MCT8308720.1 hypothetical protein [Xanthomonas translucens pv. translucens]WNJ25337.1 hypothetical protein RMA73_00475 [Xanthomonas translucens pv. translucens]WNJ25383.1 hypothetical protein RMA73_00230 [Xanthomonas translucens pv. translucens]
MTLSFPAQGERYPRRCSQSNSIDDPLIEFKKKTAAAIANNGPRQHRYCNNANFLHSHVHDRTEPALS